MGWCGIDFVVWFWEFGVDGFDVVWLVRRVVGLGLVLVSGLVVQFWVSVDFRFLSEVAGLKMVVSVACMDLVIF